MASIFGMLHINNKSNNNDALHAMFSELGSRGGDSKALHADSDIDLGVRGTPSFCRKALVTNASKTISVVLEGEIYNLKEIHQLVGETPLHAKEQGRDFQIIISLYEKFGKDFPRYLNGIFAIALWDKRQKTLYLARDHLGSHSLFYARDKDLVCFASTIQALLKTGGIDRSLSLSAMNAYFASTAISSPNTMFRSIFCLRPGTSLICNAQGDISEHEYWLSKDLQEDYNRTESDFRDEVRELILDAITIRAQYGEHYGTILSGGVDTSIIAATLANYSAEKSLAGFSISFEEIFYSDADLQQIMYDRYNILSHVATLGPNEFAEILQKGVVYLDKPVNDDAFVGMFKVFELTKQAGYNVVFDGEAADELFFTGHAYGEKDFQKFLLLPSLLRRGIFGTLFPYISLGDSLWKKGTRFLYKLGISNEERILTRLPCFYKHANPILLNWEELSSEDPHAIGKKYLSEVKLQEPLNLYHYGILKTFLTDDLLFKNERMASAHGIINRTPFIDYRLVELAFTIPGTYKLNRQTADDDGTKHIYKKAIQGLIPDEILHRKKRRGFSQPSSLWYRGELKDFLHDALFSRDSLCLEYVDKTAMQRLVSEHTSGKSNFDRWLSSLLIFELWLRAFSQ